MLPKRMVQPILFAALLAALALGLSQGAQAYDWSALTLDSGGNAGFDASIALDPGDSDGDTIPDASDNCPDTPNADQTDTDGDGTGNACDDCPNDPYNDSDGDGVCADVDNCDVDYNPGQEDMDEDGIGDACDSDIDGDTVANPVDNCPLTPNPNQEDYDDDGVGDACDPDDDNDGICDPGESDPSCEGSDLCPETALEDPVDADGCSDAQVDADGDGICNAGAPSGGPSECTGSDNCPLLATSDQTNTDVDLENAGASVDGDPLGDACDPDDDNDGFSDSEEDYLGTDREDNCPDNSTHAAWPLDMDNDQEIEATDDASAYTGKLGSVLENPSYQRLDLNADGYTTLGGDVIQYYGRIGETCD